MGTCFRSAASLLLAAAGIGVLTGVRGAGAEAAVYGTVETIDGEVYSGDVRFEENQVVLMPEGGPAVVVAFTRLNRLQLEPGLAAAPGEGRGEGIGLLGFYHRGTRFGAAPVVRLDDMIAFRWDWRDTPAPGVGSDGFSVRWMGYLEPLRTGDYTIHLRSDDGGRLVVEGAGAVVDSGPSGKGETQVTVPLERGRRHRLQVDYFELEGLALAELSWSGPDFQRTVIPQDRLHPGSFLEDHAARIDVNQGLLATYYASADFDGRSYSRVEAGIDARWNVPLPPGVAESGRRWVELRREAERAEAALDRFRTQHGLRDLEEAEEDLEFERRLSLTRATRERTAQHLRQVEAELRRVESGLNGRVAEDRDRSSLRAELKRLKREENEARARSADAEATVAEVEGIRRQGRELAAGVDGGREALAVAGRGLQEASRTVKEEIAPGLTANVFAVRWSGELRAEETEDHTLHAQADEGLRLWFNDRLVIDQPGHPGEQTHPVFLEAGQRYPIRMETVNTDGRGHARLEWSSFSRSRSPIPRGALTVAQPSLPARAAEPRAAAGPPGVALENGAYVRAPIRFADATAVRFEGLLENQLVPTLRVSRIHLQPLSPAQMESLQPNRTGLLLANQDFVEGEFIGLDKGRVTVSSVLFGTRSFDARSEVSVIVLRDGGPERPGPFNLKARDGTSIMGPRLRAEGNTIGLAGTELRIPISELVLIRRARGF